MKGGVKIKRIFKATGNLVLLGFVVIMLISLYNVIQVSRNSDGLPSILGFHLLTVLTGSMDPKLSEGDLIIIHPYSTETPKVNDVVTYRNHNGTFVTHRIVGIVDNNGTSLFQTKGDANNLVDQDLVSLEQIAGAVAFKIPKLGLLLSSLKGPLGLILLTLTISFVLSAKIIKKILAVRKEEQLTQK
ncbi:hypothetical protein J27TS8_06160 [Robertmurraya siralis]|uniref:Signal peptidase I n=1 Tax=Robertmurraya siralis TaxID=77777 RepID=A0A919WF26_9BACI|nr:signal peptidase I [Robertmurraya siralis]PAE22095.1 signal peptidase I [Bacillus sp. 7504-2]GIN60623.1 hypothetical protein J27TS8_06160 [Robertmurraya siralis]